MRYDSERERERKGQREYREMWNSTKPLDVCTLFNRDNLLLLSSIVTSRRCVQLIIIIHCDYVLIIANNFWFHIVVVVVAVTTISTYISVTGSYLIEICVYTGNDCLFWIECETKTKKRNVYKTSHMGPNRMNEFNDGNVLNYGKKNELIIVIMNVNMWMSRLFIRIGKHWVR